LQKTVPYRRAGTVLPFYYRRTGTSEEQKPFFCRRTEEQEL
jgi:hypothetical protein